ncbi:MAG: secondary thiamine-phosphate synthase enzyme YjbQ [Armatimonadetes bacterium]|nr:secondary thiamine-phosphate synthase enzyme YjbQ [Armatimonadota bacterium]
MQSLHFSTEQPHEMVNITARVQEIVTQSGVRRGLCVIHAPHTTAGITIQEGFDPDVTRDLLVALEKLAPRQGDYRHAEGNSDAHIKALLTGSSQTLPIEYGKVQLGRWQAVFFCEYDGPRSRSVWVQIIADSNGESNA